MSQQLKDIKSHRSVYEMVWRWTKRVLTTCLKSRKSSVGDQWPQAAGLSIRTCCTEESSGGFLLAALGSESKPSGGH